MSIIESIPQTMDNLVILKNLKTNKLATSSVRVNSPSEPLYRWIIIHWTIPNRPSISMKWNMFFISPSLKSFPFLFKRKSTVLFSSFVFCEFFFQIVAVVAVFVEVLLDSLSQWVTEWVRFFFFFSSIYFSFFSLFKFEELMATEEVNMPPTLPPYPQVQ